MLHRLWKHWTIQLNDCYTLWSCIRFSRFVFLFASFLCVKIHRHFAVVEWFEQIVELLFFLCCCKNFVVCRWIPVKGKVKLFLFNLLLFHFSSLPLSLSLFRFIQCNLQTDCGLFFIFTVVLLCLSLLGGLLFHLRLQIVNLVVKMYAYDIEHTNGKMFLLSAGSFRF